MQKHEHLAHQHDKSAERSVYMLIQSSKVTVDLHAKAYGPFSMV